jgi:long-chain acyl-CoA synthetase
MAVAWHAVRRPGQLALASAFGDRTFAELNGRANRLSRLLTRHHIGAGSAIAVVTRNRPEFVEAYCAALRSGIRVTPVNWHLTGEETGYIIDNCEAAAVVYDASLGTAEVAAAHAGGCRLRLAVGGTIPGYEDYDSLLEAEDASDIEHPLRGSQMIYTSGSTGRP